MKKLLFVTVAFISMVSLNGCASLYMSGICNQLLLNSL